MKRIRIAAGLMLSAALFTVSIGTHVASGHEAARVAVDLPAPFCESLSDLLVENGGVGPAARQASVVIEIVGPPPLIAPLDWSLWEAHDVSLFKCDRPEPGIVSSGLAVAP